MIVDLVRNDLSVTASKKSVKVIELCKVYKFKGVHQMISTITSTIKDDKCFIDLKYQILNLKHILINNFFL